MSQRTLVSTVDLVFPIARLISQPSNGNALSRLVLNPARGLFVCACLCTIAQSNMTQAAEKRGVEPGWVPVVLARGALADQIDATPMELRPYRPFHFYGNTIRRMYYRGNPLPRVGEVIATPIRAITPRSRSKAFEASKLGRL